MTFLPVVERELRAAARRPWTHGVRLLAALCVVVTGLAIAVGNQGSMSPSSIGRLIFQAVSILGFVLALLAGTFLTADCLCSEKREGTLGLLFLTDLRGYDVVLGKLAATSMVSVYALLGIVPMLGLPLLMGGVGPGEFGRMVLALLDTLFLSLAMGMLASACCRDTRDAMLASFGQMLFLTGVLPLLAFCAGFFLRGSSNLFLLLPSPLLAYLAATNSGVIPRVGMSGYWISIGLVGGLAAFQLALAMWLLPRSWQEGNWQARAASRMKRPGRTRDRHLALNPFYWLVTRAGFPGRARAVILGLLFALWWGLFLAAGLIPKGRGNDECLLCCLFMAYGLHFVVKVMVAMQASQHLCEDRRSGALELLLVTPVTPHTILDGQMQALKAQFRRMLGMLCAINVGLFWLFVVVNPVGMPEDVRWTFGLFFVGGALLLLSDFDALGWTGMAEAMAGRRHHQAVLVTLARIMAPPVLLLGLLIFVRAGSGASTGGVNSIHFIWFCIGLVTSRLVAANRKALLRDHFRTLATGGIPAAKKKTDAPGFYWVPAPTVPPRPSS